VNDEERRLWVMNHEPLYDRFRAERARNGRVRPSNSDQEWGLRSFIREHRAEIDKVIAAELNPERRTHDLDRTGQL
jgi:hypothetical protein